MSDQLDILIKVKADLAAAQATVAELKELKRQAVAAGVSTGDLDDQIKAAERAQESAGKKLEDQTKKNTEHTGHLGKAVKLLTNQFGELGHLSHFAMSLPALAIAGLAVGISRVIEKVKQWNEKLLEMERTGKEAIGATRDQIHQLTVEHITANGAFQKAQEAQKIQSDANIANLKAEETQLKELAKTAEALELARARSDEEKTAIGLRYAGINRDIDLTARQKELTENQRVLEEKKAALLAQGNVANSTLGDMTPEAAKARLERLQFEKAAAEKLIAAPESALGGTKQFNTKLGPGRNLGEVFFHYESNPEFTRLQEELKRAQEFKLKLQREELNLTKGVTAAGVVKNLSTDATRLEGEISRQAGAIATHKAAGRQTELAENLTKLFPNAGNIYEGGIAAMRHQQERYKFASSPAGRLELDAESAALTAEASGKPLTPKQQALVATARAMQDAERADREAVRRMDDLFKALNFNSKAVLDNLAKAVANQNKDRHAIEQIANTLNAVQFQVRTLQRNIPSHP